MITTAATIAARNAGPLPASLAVVAGTSIATRALELVVLITSSTERDEC